LEKIKFQWKTLRKAFMDLNVKKSGSIEPKELWFYFEHWGLGGITEAQFQQLFDKFDLDKDGKISYKDFQMTVGSEIHPAEGLYFR
jgi:Ca2+-binding EF-hand superfamily protein